MGRGSTWGQTQLNIPVGKGGSASRRGTAGSTAGLPWTLNQPDLTATVTWGKNPSVWGENPEGCLGLGAGLDQECRAWERQELPAALRVTAGL